MTRVISAARPVCSAGGGVARLTFFFFFRVEPSHHDVKARLNLRPIFLSSSSSSASSARSSTKMTAEAEAALRAWIRSPDRVMAPNPKGLKAKGRELGLDRASVQSIIDSDPELTRLKPGGLTRGRVPFRLKRWCEGEIDLGFVNYDAKVYGLFFLGTVVDPLPLLYPHPTPSPPYLLRRRRRRRRRPS